MAPGDALRRKQAYDRAAAVWRFELDELAATVHDLIAQVSPKCAVKKRLKSLPSLNDKMGREKYRNGSETIKDLLGLRVVVPFLDDVDAVVSLLKSGFG